MRTFAVVIVSLLVVAGCSATRGPKTSPEKVLQPWPMPVAEWRGSRGLIEGSDAGKFEHTPTGDTIMTITKPTAGGAAASDFRRTFDETAGEGCTTWASQLLDETPVGSFPRQIWLNECTRDGEWHAQLNLYITGKDAGYFVYYDWNERPDAAGVAKWAAYLREVKVCDDRTARGIPCPALTQAERPPL